MAFGFFRTGQSYDVSFIKRVQNNVLIFKISSEFLCVFLRKIHTCVRPFLKNSSHSCPSLSQEQFTLVSVSFSRTVHTCVRLFLKNSSHLCPSPSQEQFTLVSVSFSRTVRTCVRLFLKNSSHLCPSLS